MSERTPYPTSQDLALLPITYRAGIPESYLDEMGHMNVMWYTHLFSQGTLGLFDLIGLTPAYFASRQAGTFALEQHTRYLAEVRIGQQVSIRGRLLGRNDRCLHFMNFMTREEDGMLAAVGESIAAHIDMRVRRTAPFDPSIVDLLDKLLAEHQGLGWAAPVCGALQLKGRTP